MDNLSHHWLQSIRNESLTFFFKLFPYFASDYFYILVIAISYWYYPRKKFVIDFGFLIPIATLINITLKNFFSIPRPHQSLHLVPFHIDYGFPSGDVQVAVVLWGIMLIRSKNMALKVFASLIIFGISLSRVYLGVHSIMDVLSGMLFGSIILFIYTTNYFQQLRDRWFICSTKSYWYISLVITLIYLSSASFTTFSVIALASIGVLIGYGISIRYINTFANRPGANIFQIFCALITLFVFYKFFPIQGSLTLMRDCTIIGKYMALTILIYMIIPYVLIRIRQLSLQRTDESKLL